MNTAFLIRGIGFTLQEIGFIYKTTSLIAGIVGGIVGGIYMARLGLFSSLMIFGFLQAFANFAYVLLAIVGKYYFIAILSIFAEYFCSGLSTTAFLVFLIALCDHRYTATQYALFSALTSVGRVFSGPGAALVVEHFGWAWFYCSSFLIGMPTLLLLWWLKDRIAIFGTGSVSEQSELLY